MSSFFWHKPLIQPICFQWYIYVPRENILKTVKFSDVFREYRNVILGTSDLKSFDCSFQEP